MSHERKPITRALISVYDKTGLEDLARGLHAAGVAIVSTGSTAATIESYGVPVTKVEDLTGFPECLDGRVKTLHPRVHAGLLADLRLDTHREQLAELDVEPFDLLVSNLYPFQRTIESGASFEDCIEQIDIGGPAMVRSSAKNHANVAVITSPGQYGALLAAIAEGGFTYPERRKLAAEAFAHTATYDAAVGTWMALATRMEGFPPFVGHALSLEKTLRYGENPHQPAALYNDPQAPAGLAQAEQLGGKEMSYNNYVDADAAWRSAHDFDEPCAAIIKHANPCGIAVGKDLVEAHRKAHECDPLSAFGGVIAVNGEVTLKLAEQIKPIFTEVVVAPSFADDALEVLRSKKNLRILRAPKWTPEPVEFKQISGGMLAQTPDRNDAEGDDPANWKLIAGPAADEKTMADLVFAWHAVRSVKSNAILLVKDEATVGAGMGQVNRVDAARLAVARAGEDRARGSVAASDAFFPFADGAEVLFEAGVTAIVQPGGSIRDEEVIAAAEAAGVTMYATGARHFYH